MLTNDFPKLRQSTIRNIALNHGNNLAPTYLALTKLVASAQNHAMDIWIRPQPESKPNPRYSSERIEKTIENPHTEAEGKYLRELVSARILAASFHLEMEAEERAKEALQAEKRNLEEATALGHVEECGCCFGEVPRNRLVYCNGEKHHVSP